MEQHALGNISSKNPPSLAFTHALVACPYLRYKTNIKAAIAVITAVCVSEYTCVWGSEARLKVCQSVFVFRHARILHVRPGMLVQSVHPYCHKTKGANNKCSLVFQRGSVQGLP